MMTAAEKLQHMQHEFEVDTDIFVRGEIENTTRLTSHLDEEAIRVLIFLLAYEVNEGEFKKHVEAAQQLQQQLKG